MGRVSMLLGSLVVLLAAGCGSTSSSTVAGPTPVRCQLDATNTTPSFNASGGPGAVTVSAERECAWSGAAQAAWIVLDQPTSGQGDGKLGYRVTQNPAGIPRRGSINVGGVIVEVGQDAAPCRFTLSTREIAVPSAGGTFSVDLQAPAGCGWSSSSQVPWVTISGGAQGTGPGRVTLAVSANPGPTRGGTVTVAGVTVQISQHDSASDPTQPPGTPLPPPPADCQYEWSPAAADVASAGGDGLVAMRTRPECSWEITIDAAWVSLRAPASGRGAGDATVEYRVAANSERDARQARMRAGNATFTIRQAGTSDPEPPGQCDFTVNPTSVSMAAAGGEGLVAVNTSGGCSWSATSNAGWIAVLSGSGGTGSGQVGYRVDANTSGSSRTGTLSIAGRTVTIAQAGVELLPETVSGSMQGLSGSCPSLSFRVGGREVQTSSTTTFRRTSCSRLENGDVVTVSGVAAPGGPLQALDVRLDRDADDDDDDDD